MYLPSGRLGDFMEEQMIAFKQIHEVLRHEY
jgi:hypothetical protein